MKIYLQSIDFDLWEVVEHGARVPSKEVDNKKVPKKRSEFDEDNKRKLSLTLFTVD